RDLESRLDEARAQLDEVVRTETETRAAELERTLALARAQSLTRLIEEERRMAEERRAALHERERRASAELSEALAKVEQRTSRRERERELRDRVAAEESEAVQRIEAGFADVERRQLDQLKRIVERTSDSFSDALAKQFGDEIKHAREDAAQRLARELDKAVAYFAREAQTVLAERLAHVADAGGQRLERKLSQIGSSLEHEQHSLAAGLQKRIGEAEVELRTQVQSLAADAEAERTVLNARLNELQRRIDDLLNAAESRLPTTFRAG